ncbi:MAG: glycosyltransferase family 4 protein [Acidimicrobiia bacterium]|nr:glycosyltransferase family 4 protein [Acidimicrobiia bacterium]
MKGRSGNEGPIGPASGSAAASAGPNRAVSDTLTAPVPDPIRLTVVMTHPVQYVAPWLRWMAEHRPGLDLTVLYGALPDPDQQGVGYGRAFRWDVPLTEGYRFEVCGPSAGRRFGDHDFFGIDVPDIGRRIAATRPDVVLVPGWHAAMLLRAIVACRRRGIPVLYRGDSTLNSAPSRWRRPLWRLKTRALLRLYDGYLSVGSMSTAYLRSFNVPEPLIRWSPHVVDHERFAREADRGRTGGGRARLRASIGATAEDFVVLFAGRFIERKRPLDAVRAVAGLGRDAVLLMAGDGVLAPEVRAEAHRLGVRVSWRGFVNQTGLPEVFAASDCLLMPSRFETWGLLVNEALASGVPCVVTRDVAAGADLIEDGVTGYTVEVGDIDAMARRLGDVRSACAGTGAPGPACRTAAARADFTAASDGLIAMARRVLAQSGGPARVPTRVVVCSGHMSAMFGVERMTLEVLGALRGRGAAVHCIVNRWESSRVVDGAERIGASWSLGYYEYPLRVGGPATLARALWDVVATSAGLVRDAGVRRPTHVLMPDYVAVLRNAPALVCLRLAGVTTILRLGNAPERGPWRRRLWRGVINPLVTRFIANSDFTRGELVATGVRADKVQRIYNWAPRPPVPPGELPRVPARIVYVGQMIPPKGVHVLLEALGRLATRGIDWSLDAVGDIDGWEPEGWAGYRAGLRARADREDLRGRVRFLGVREDVPALLAAATVHVCPSQPEQREAFGIVNVEAKLAGLPSVVTPYGALPELFVHQQDGWICRDGSAEAIAEGLAWFLADPIRTAEAGRAALRSAERFSRERFVVSWLAAFGLSADTAGTGSSDPEPAVGSHVR